MEKPICVRQARMLGHDSFKVSTKSRYTQNFETNAQFLQTKKQVGEA